MKKLSCSARLWRNLGRRGLPAGVTPRVFSWACLNLTGGITAPAEDPNPRSVWKTVAFQKMILDMSMFFVVSLPELTPHRILVFLKELNARAFAEGLSLFRIFNGNNRCLVWFILAYFQNKGLIKLSQDILQMVCQIFSWPSSYFRNSMWLFSQMTHPSPT